MHQIINNPDIEGLRLTYVKIIREQQLWTQGKERSIQYILRETATALHVACASSWRLSANTMLCNHYYELATDRFMPQDSLELDHYPEYFEAVTTERIVSVSDVETDYRTQALCSAYLKEAGVTSLLDIGLMKEGKLNGILCLEHKGEHREWAKEEVVFAVSIADLISQIENYYVLKESEQKYRVLFDQCADAIFITRNNTIVECNSTALTMFGCRRADVIGQHPGFFSPSEQPDGKCSYEKAQMMIDLTLKGNKPVFEWMHSKLDGTPFWTQVTLDTLSINGEQHIIGTIHNIQDYRSAEETIIKLNSLHTAIIDSARYTIITTDHQGIIQSFNHAAEALLGFDATELVGRTAFADLIKPLELERRAADLSHALKRPIKADHQAVFSQLEANNLEQEWTYITKDGKEIPVMMSPALIYDADSDQDHYLAIAYDLSDWKATERELIAYQEELEYRASHDSLTDLANRTQLHLDAQRAITEASIHQRRVAMMLLDLDRFKEVNDTLGHHIGDQLLVQLADRLKQIVSLHNAHLYRLGGDEFAVLFTHFKHSTEILHFATQLTDMVRQPINVKGATLELGGSLGISIYPEQGSNSHDLLRCADVAMYSAKSHSSSLMFYDVNFDAHSPRRLKLMAELGLAIRENQLTLHYQPRINLKDNTCSGCEALIRWEHPELGRIPPDEFIPLAEMGDIIHQLSRWVIERAIKQIVEWQQMGVILPIAINLSAKNLVDQSLAREIASLLHAYHVESQWLEIEITESAFITDPERAETTLRDLNTLGIHMAIDDFGTGFSSLSFLKRLPISTLKIDRSFVDELMTDDQDAAIVKSTIGLAQSFGLETIAEGVEDQNTLSILGDLQCNHAQGYHICKPCPADQFVEWYSQQEKDDHTGDFYII
jgi:diguanylate cyclase (GGDEF)-like protein/PAS domain S-box-containing protein